MAKSVGPSSSSPPLPTPPSAPAASTRATPAAARPPTTARVRKKQQSSTQKQKAKTKKTTKKAHSPASDLVWFRLRWVGLGWCGWPCSLECLCPTSINHPTKPPITNPTTLPRPPIHTHTHKHHNRTPVLSGAGFGRECRPHHLHEGPGQPPHPAPRCEYVVVLAFFSISFSLALSLS
jgi:hypothetical protein